LLDVEDCPAAEDGVGGALGLGEADGCGGGEEEVEQLGHFGELRIGEWVILSCELDVECCGSGPVPMARGDGVNERRNIWKGTPSL
jgi:hypothetical protein